MNDKAQSRRAQTLRHSGTEQVKRLSSFERPHKEFYRHFCRLPNGPEKYWQKLSTPTTICSPICMGCPFGLFRSENVPLSLDPLERHGFDSVLTKDFWKLLASRQMSCSGIDKANRKSPSRNIRVVYIAAVDK